MDHTDKQGIYVVELCKGIVARYDAINDPEFVELLIDAGPFAPVTRHRLRLSYRDISNLHSRLKTAAEFMFMVGNPPR